MIVLGYVGLLKSFEGESVLHILATRISSCISEMDCGIRSNVYLDHVIKTHSKDISKVRPHR